MMCPYGNNLPVILEGLGAAWLQNLTSKKEGIKQRKTDEPFSDT